MPSYSQHQSNPFVTALSELLRPFPPTHTTASIARTSNGREELSGCAARLTLVKEWVYRGLVMSDEMARVDARARSPTSHEVGVFFRGGKGGASACAVRASSDLVLRSHAPAQESQFPTHKLWFILVSDLQDPSATPFNNASVRRERRGSVHAVVENNREDLRLSICGAVRAGFLDQS